jgi:hypothetical protein
MHDIRLFALSALVILIPNLSFAHGISCNGEMLDFEESLSHNFYLESLIPSTTGWTDLNGCSSPNLASGLGAAACIAASNSAAVDAVMQSYDFDLTCLSQAALSFSASFSNPLGDAVLTLEAKQFSAASWTAVAEWTSLPAFSNLVVPLTAFSGSGLSTTLVRWRFRSPASSSPALAQIDNLALSCTPGPQADVSVTVPSTGNTLPLGARRRYSLEVANYGPEIATNTLVSHQFTKGSGTISSTSLILSSSTTIQSATKEFATTEVQWLAGQALPNGLLRAEIEFQVTSAVCDNRLPNNTRRIAVLLDPEAKEISKVSGGYKQTAQLLKKLKTVKSCSDLKKNAAFAKSLASVSMASAVKNITPFRASQIAALTKSIAKLSKSAPKNKAQCMQAKTKAIERATLLRKLWKEELL